MAMSPVQVHIMEPSEVLGVSVITLPFAVGLPPTDELYVMSIIPNVAPAPTSMLVT